VSFLEKLKKGMQVKPQDKRSEETGAKKTAIDETEIQDNEPAGEKASKTLEPPKDEKKSAGKTERKPRDAQRSTEEKTAREEKAAKQKPNFEVKPIHEMYTKESFSKEKETAQEGPDNWLESEGQLAVDVFQTDDELIIQAPIAGMKVEDIDVIIEEEIITIKGARKNPFAGKPTGHFIEECFWGPFSRKIILPLDVDGARADASMKEGVLTIRIPKIVRDKKRKVSIRE
jgi:HSP20 family protein